MIFAANSFLGKELINYFTQHKFEIIAVTRNANETFEGILAHETWDGRSFGTWTNWLNTCHGIINLSGRSVNCRYNAQNKAEIYASRLESTAIIQAAIETFAPNQPICWINAASATIYEHEEFNPHTESRGILGTGFSVDVCKKWEAQFFSPSPACIRKIAIRTSIVFGTTGGVLPVLIKLAQRGLGGKMGNGRQQVSWIAIDDFCRAVHFLLVNEKANGVYNLAAPHPLRNERVQRLIRETYGIRWYIDQPKWLLQIGAVLIGTETELILKSRFVIPERLLTDGFQFSFPELGPFLIHSKKIGAKKTN